MTEKQQRRGGWEVWLPVAVSLVVNVVAIFAVSGFDRLPATHTDEHEYVRLAEQFHDGEGLSGFRRTPLWPWMLALSWKVTGVAVWPGQLLNALFGALAVLGVQHLAGWWLSRRAAAIAALIVAMLPTLVFLNASLYTESLTTCLFIWASVLAMAAVQRADPEDLGTFTLRPMDWAALGAVVALLNLVKPAFLLWPALLALFGAVLQRRCLPRLALAMLITTLAFCLTMTPWWVRNYRSSGGRFVPFTSAGDESLLETNNPELAAMVSHVAEVDGRKIWMGPGKYVSNWRRSGLVTIEEIEALDELDGHRLMRQRALEWIGANPGTWLGLAVKKLGYGFGVWPVWQGSWLTLVAGLPFTIIFLLSLPGFVRIARRGGRGTLLLTHPLGFLALTVMFIGSWRYRSAYEASFVIAMMVAAPLWLRLLPGPLRRLAYWLEADDGGVSPEVVRRP